MAGQDTAMERAPRRKGVCVITIKRQPASLLITVTTRPDVEEVAGQGTEAFVSVDEAVSALREFLVLFTLADDA